MVTLLQGELEQAAEEEVLPLEDTSADSSAAHAAEDEALPDDPFATHVAYDQDTSSRMERLMAEASSSRHLVSHFPKNSACEACQRARMYATRRSQKRKPSEAVDLSDVTRFGQRFAADHVIVSTVFI